MNSPGCQISNDIEDVNKRIFTNYKVEQAKEVLRMAKTLFGDNIAVSFSGGKDSLAVLDLACRVLGPETLVVFNNTTVEFPDTVKYVHKLAEDWGLNLIETKPQKSFLSEVKNRGWATREDRWCCTPYKKEPFYRYTDKMDIDAVVVGTIRTESIYRRCLKPLKFYKDNQDIVRVHPIFDWNHQEVWQYIKENDLPYNPLYDKGYMRIGCWCCPLNGISHYKRLQKTHPKMFKALSRFEPTHPVISRFIQNQNNKNKK